MFQPVLRPGHARGLATGGRADRGRGLSDQRLQRVSTLSTGQRQKMTWPAPAERSVDPVPRRADPGPRRCRRPGHPGAGPRLEGCGARADGAADHALHGRGRRAVRADRDRGPRPDPRHRLARGAQASGAAGVDLPPRAGPPRGGRGTARTPARCRLRGHRGRLGRRGAARRGEPRAGGGRGARRRGHGAGRLGARSTPCAIGPPTRTCSWSVGRGFATRSSTRRTAGASTIRRPRDADGDARPSAEAAEARTGGARR